MARYLILGAGHFGYLALSRLAQLNPQDHFIIVDQNPAALESCRLPGLANLRLAAGEGVAFLESSLQNDRPLDWIIPTIPRHVAFDWVWRRRPPGSEWEMIPVPEAVENLAVQAFRGREGEVYLSSADFICPDDCPEPADHCQITGLPRIDYLYEVLEDILLPDFQPLVVRSQQLTPGVGGYPPAALSKLWHQVQAESGNLLIATACRCHGVVHAVKSKAKGGTVGL
jgi:hypothetical protein